MVNTTTQQQKKHHLTLFSSSDGNVAIDVRIENETVWLSLNQLAQLFGRDKSVISRHLKNIFADKEIEHSSVVANFATTATDDKTYQVEHFNLDAILSVGYRVNSKQATQFRQWANSVLKNYLLKGYAVNQNVIDTTNKEYQNLITLLGKTLVNNQLIDHQGENIIELINHYATTWSTLLQYDEDRLILPTNIHKPSTQFKYEQAIKAIIELKQKLISVNEATSLFGNERNDNLQSILANLDQTMFGEELYKSVEEKAANLLYMAIKDHW
jgi:prophage antirepressor-like protein